MGIESCIKYCVFAGHSERVEMKFGWRAQRHFQKRTTNKCENKCVSVIHRNSFYSLENRIHSIYGAPEMLLNVTTPRKKGFRFTCMFFYCFASITPWTYGGREKNTKRVIISENSLHAVLGALSFRLLQPTIFNYPFRLKESYDSGTNYRTNHEHVRVRARVAIQFLHTFKINAVWWVVAAAIQHFNHPVDRRHTPERM